MTQLAVYRFRVFVEMLGWKLPTDDGLELDQFDRPDTLYLTAFDDEEIVGTARLLPTTRPYLLGEVFPHLLGGTPPPCSPAIWELSRFAAVDLRKRSASMLTRFSTPVAAALFRSTIETAAAHGAERLISVSPIGIERLLRQAGFRAAPASAVHVIDGHPFFACWIECRPDVAHPLPACIPYRDTRHINS